MGVTLEIEGLLDGVRAGSQRCLLEAPRGGQHNADGPFQSLAMADPSISMAARLADPE